MEKKAHRTLLIGVLLFLLLSNHTTYGAEIDPSLSKLSFSGFLRIRTWYTSSRIKVPDKFPATDQYKDVDYQDLFFRNRFNIKVLPTIEIRSVFDIISALGKEETGFALGDGLTNLVTRDVYTVIKFSDRSVLEVGLKPFSLPGGYILARDATGIQYNHDFFNRKVSAYAATIKAFDDADDSFGEESDPPDYQDDNIYYAGANITFLPDIKSETYYVYEYDRYTTDDDMREATLHWIGLHNKLVPGNWLIRIGGIYNWGFVRRQDETDQIIRTDIKAGLLEFEAGYKFNVLHCSLIAEGATGDPDDPDDERSFQDIKSSHGFSLIAVDNTGGLAIRGSGESCWYGLYGGGLKLQYTVLDSVLVKLKLMHFRTTKELERKGKKSTWFGDEFDFEAEYRYRDVLSLFFSTGVFRPQRAYSALEIIDHAPGGVILEVMAGMMITY